MTSLSLDSRSLKWVKQGRGKGSGKDYRPWLTVRDLPSAGRSHRIWGFQTQRTHHLLSDLELAAFFLFDWNPSVTDIREQYPLRLEDTIELASQAEQAVRLHNMLVDMGYASELLEPLIYRAFEDHPGLVMKDLMPLILSWYQSAEIEKPASSTPKLKTMKKADWHILDSEDLRFLFSQSANEETFQESLGHNGLFFDAQNWVNSFG